MPRLTLELPDYVLEELTGLTAGKAQHIVMDALYEFSANRSTPNVEAYVAKRYGTNEHFDDNWRAEKIKQVRQRCKWADALHSGRVSLDLSASVED